MGEMLMIPIHLDALYLQSDKSVVEAMADFSRLPYVDPGQCEPEPRPPQDVNPDVAYVSAEILSEPFQNLNLPLKAGLHLHWALPAALTRGTHTDAGTTYPPVPNRWLVVRTGGGLPDGRWVVESDYLFPEGQGTQAVSVSYPVTPNVQKGEYQPFRYLGRKMLLGDWNENDPTAEYLDTLTAVGYGEPTFAAFYPNCYSVFGFYDHEIVGDIPDDLQYDVVGWYSEKKQDYLKTYLDAFKANYQGGNDAPSPQELLKAIEDRFQCSITLAFIKKEDFLKTLGNPNGEAIWTDLLAPTIGWLKSRDAATAWIVAQKDRKAKTLNASTHAAGLDSAIEAILETERQIEEPERLCCYARITNLSLHTDTSDSTTIAVGNTGTEALSAYLAHEIDAENKATIEDQLEALLLAPALKGRALDVVAKFKEARHEKGFTAVPGGTLWTIRLQSEASGPANAQDAHAQSTLPDDLAHPLNALNLLQQQYDQARFEIASMRRQLFSDWYKYMLCAYPPDDTRDHYPNIDDVKSFIETCDLAPLQDKLEATGALSLARDAAERITGASGPDTNSLADDLATHLNALYQAVVAFNQGKAVPYVLQQIPGPRYWQPREPVVLIPGVQPPPRPGQDGSALSCSVITVDDPFDPKNIHAFLEWGQNTIDGQANTGHPFMLEWEVEVFPIQRGNSGAYQPDFIKGTFTLDESAPDLVVRSGIKTERGANIYSGRSLLTPYASSRLRTAIDAYLAEQPDDASGAEEYTNPVYTARQAQNLLKDFKGLSQSLGGFNAALLGQKQAMQLPIADPLGFDDYQPFAEQVAAAVQGSIQIAPEPLNDFNPIRSGAMKLLQLRLIDTFGQPSDLDVSSVVTSETMTTGVTKPVWLPPRLVQPARVTFRWLSADPRHDDAEMNAHPATTPICGWILPNNLDGSLMVYGAQGNALGSIDQEARWQPPPGSDGNVIEQADPVPEPVLPNPHLRKVIDTIRSQGPTFLGSFITTLDEALENIDPENFAHHECLALLMGRPIAVVRARVGLDLQGWPAVDQGWLPFRRALQHQQKIQGRDTHGFEHVSFPIRIGEYKQLNDGVVGYWIEDQDGNLGGVFYAPEANGDQNEHIKSNAAAPLDLSLSAKAAPQTLTLLVDPRGVVHATSGIVPTKVISIPPDQFAAALRAIEVTFLTAPILTDLVTPPPISVSPSTPPLPVNLPLPSEPGYRWSWLEKEGGVWRETPRADIGKVSPVAAFSGPQALREGWLKLSKAPDELPDASSETNRPPPP